MSSTLFYFEVSLTFPLVSSQWFSNHFPLLDLQSACCSWGISGWLPVFPPPDLHLCTSGCWDPRHPQDSSKEQRDQQQTTSVSCSVHFWTFPWTVRFHWVWLDNRKSNMKVQFESKIRKNDWSQSMRCFFKVHVIFFIEVAALRILNLCWFDDLFI